MKDTSLELTIDEVEEVHEMMLVLLFFFSYSFSNPFSNPFSL